MGILPHDRVNQARLFLNPGIDYCSPFYIKEKKFRNRGKIKLYVSLRRFFARREKCLNLYSDNATNFVGGNNELKSFPNFVKSNGFNQEVADSISNQCIQWHFSPLRSPHFDCLWEAAVKSFLSNRRRNFIYLRRIICIREWNRSHLKLTINNTFILWSQRSLCSFSSPFLNRRLAYYTTRSKSWWNQNQQVVSLATYSIPQATCLEEMI